MVPFPRGIVAGGNPVAGGPMKPSRKNRRLSSAHPRANAEAKSPAAYPPTMMLCTGENIGFGG